MKNRKFYLAFCVFCLLSSKFFFTESVYAQGPEYVEIAMYGSTLPGSWENEEHASIISRLFINWDFEEKLMEVEAIEDCHDRNCAWAPGQLVKSGNRYIMKVTSFEAERRLIITPINAHRLHVRVITKFHDSKLPGSWEYYFKRSGGASRGNSNK